MVRVGIVGAAGRMGRTLIEACVQHPEVALTAAVEQPQHEWLAKDVGQLAGLAPLQVELKSDLSQVTDEIDCLIDFTRPDLTLENAKICAAAGVALVAGTTGLTAEQSGELAQWAKKIPIMWAPNMSVGVNLLKKLVAQTAAVLGEDFDVEIIEAHHRYKVDAPSGTALALGQAAAGALGRDLTKDAIYGREGQTGERNSNTIGFATIRGGDVVGDHTVLFAGLGERIELTHKASSRMTFAKGAVRAAVWIADQKAGFYGIDDVLGLNT